MSNHSCQALVFRCMDFRIKLSALSELLSSIGYPEGSYDLVSVAGSGKDLLSKTQAESAFLIKQIELSKKLHCVAEIIILYHDNCGAYGIADLADEATIQKQDLKILKKIIKKKFSDLDIKTYVIKGTPKSQLVLEEIN